MSTSDPYGGNTGQSGGAGHGGEQPAGPSPWSAPQGAPQPSPADPYGQPTGYPPNPYGQQPAYPGYPVPAPTGTNPLAIVALVLAIVCVPPIGLDLGVIALIQVNRSGQQGRGIAIAAIVISAVVTVIVTIGVIAGVAADTKSASTPPVSAPAVPDRPASPSPSPERKFDGKVGDCLSMESVEDRFFRLPVVKCTTPHRAEIFAVIPLTGDYPGWDKMKDTGLATCEKRYNKLPRSLRKRLGQVQLLIFGPQDERAWREGFHASYCILLDEDRTYTRQLVKS